MQQEFDGLVNVVGVGSRDDLDRLREFVSTSAVGSFEHLADLDGEVWKQFEVLGQPSYAFIDASGVIGDVHTGALGVERLRRRMNDLVAS